MPFARVLSSSTCAHARRYRRLQVVTLAAIALAACSGDGNRGITPPPVTCEDVTSPAVLQGITMSPDVARCLDLEGAGARYLIVPQLAAPEPATPLDVGEEPPSAEFTLANGATVGAGVVAAVAVPEERPISVQARFDRRLRDFEHRNAGLAARDVREGPRPNLSVGPPPDVGSQRQFTVLNTLAAQASFTTITATLKFGGDNVLIYQDDAAPPDGLTDSEYAGLGALFDTKLYPVDVSHFGNPSDIDDNQRVIVLLTPVVNQLVTANECSTQGFVTGFFFGRDLIPSLPNSNQGEIFYSIVPDPSGSVSCAHTKDQVRENVPSTFVHEFQHMISFNQHVLARNGPDEVPWLNEGLSHIAEELASLIYERDPSQPRSSPDQLFPDSAQTYITGNVDNAWSYLSSPTTHSVTNFRDFGTLEERGAAWLFLRWVGDQFGDGIFKRLVETNRVGAANLEAQTGATLQQQLADFAVAIDAAKLPEATRAELPKRFTYTSRDWQRIFARFNQIEPNRFPRPYPLVEKTLPAGGGASGRLTYGTQDWYVLTTGAEARAGAVHFSGPGSAALPSESRPQVTVFRLPNP